MICNLVVFQPSVQALLNLKAYDDVVESLNHGLIKAGCTSHVTHNSYIREADLYLLFGAQIIPVEILEFFHSNTVFFSFEQYHSVEGTVPGNLAYVYRKFHVAEYSRYNLSFWNTLGEALGCRKDVWLMPVPFSENLVFEKNVPEDIDVLYYGSLGGERKLRFLSAAAGNQLIKPKIVLMQNIYGKERDAFIKRSKIVLSATGDRILPEVRVSYLMTNSKAVISDYDDNDYIDDFYRESLLFASAQDIEQKIHALLSDDGYRRNYESQLNAKMKTRDVSSYVATLLQRVTAGQ